MWKTLLFVITVAASPLTSRDTPGQGWSLQSQTCPSNSRSCGGPACCPSASYCQSAANGEVASCCTTNSVCRGAVEGRPTCADSAWSLWKGSYGNGFCCQVGIQGAFINGDSIAGICTIAVPPNYSSATLMSVGSGSPATSVPASTTSPSTTSTTLPSTGPTSPSTRQVFAHYMVGTFSDSNQAVKDVQDAKRVGFDAFALNTHTIDTNRDTWMAAALQYLFDAADANGFKLFLSFDMSWNQIQPSAVPAFLQNYINRPSYYRVNGRPFISTFRGGTYSNEQWDSGMRQPLRAQGNDPYFVPNFDDSPGYPNSFFQNYPTVDGAFNWETAWPVPGNTPASVSSDVDRSIQEQAHNAGKVYMMPISSFQFKYLDNTRYYRIGETNLPQRMTQVLANAPDFVELITWNDAGEGHYVGNFFTSQIDGRIQAYANGFDHTGWQKIITPFINAYKNGATSASQINSRRNPTGTLWYRTLLTTASCSSSLLNYQSARDTLNYAVLLPNSGYTIKVFSNGVQLSSVVGSKGLNYAAVSGLRVGGGQTLQILDSTGNVVSSVTGTKDVQSQSSSSICNWNYEVVGF